MKYIEIIANLVFWIWVILRLIFHIGSRNAGWAAFFGGLFVFTSLIVFVSLSSRV